MARHKKSDRTRRKILAAAARAFAGKGYYGTTTRELSQITGYEQSSLYHHFGDKEALYRSALIHSHRNILRILNRAVDRRGGLYRELASIFDTFIRFNHRYGGQMFLLFSLVFAGPPGLREEYARVYFADFGALVAAAFARNPPSGEAVMKEGLCTDLLHGMFFALSSQTRTERLENWPQALAWILGEAGE